MTQRICVLLAACLLSVFAAPTAARPIESPRTLAAVEVAGVMPGPGMWQVRRGDHVLWLVGTLKPLPERMQWRSAELDARLAEANAILGEPGLTVTTGRGMLHALTLLPSLLGARKLPDGERLADVLAPELHARWSELKAEHLGRDRAIERWRPLFAAGKLHSKAVERAGLAFTSPVADHINEARKRRDLPRILALHSVKLDAPRQALRDFKQGQLDDIDCFERTLQRLESDLALLSARAEAWAIGDIEALRTLHGSDPASACLEALSRAPLLQQHGFADVRGRMRARWLEAVDDALSTHRTTVGAVPIEMLLDVGSEGVLAAFAARGYRVLGPDDVDHGKVDKGVIGRGGGAVDPAQELARIAE